MEWWRSCERALALGPVPAVGRLTWDSRQVLPGSAFVCVPGAHGDGHDYISSAIIAGAAAIVVQSDREAKWSPFREKAPLVVVPDTRAAMGHLAAAVYGNPSRGLMTIGVTGTDGKTTTSHLASHVLTALGRPCGYLSSVGFETGSGFRVNASHMTTLEAPAVQEALADAVINGREAMVVEASSEGLAQHRLDGCEFDAAIFTNLTRDHLDFHGTMEAYRAAKGTLFEMLDLEAGGKRLKVPAEKAAVVNADDPESRYFATRSKARLLTYGIQQEAFLRAEAIDVLPHALRFEVRTKTGLEATVRVPLFGRFNVSNCLAALGLALSQGLPLAGAAQALATFPGVPGRMERIDCGQRFTVVVDIASTPAALENVLMALRPATRGKLWAVFGAAGGRDPARRDGMGRVAGRLADRAVLTNEDPRDEDPEAIIEAIASGLVESGAREGEHFVREPDRRSAIHYAFSHAGPGDVILLAGKATETSMVFGPLAVPWDERAVARELLLA